MKNPLGRLAGAVLACAALTLAAAPAALAQDETSTTTTTSPADSTTETPTSSETPSTTSVVPTSEAPSSSATTPGTAKKDPAEKDAKKDVVTTSEKPPVALAAPPEKPYTDNVGHGFIGLTGDGVLVIACASGAPGDLATANLTVRGGPDQDEADGKYWNYDVSVVGTPTGPKGTFSWTCGKNAGQGEVDFEQKQPEPSTSTTPAPSTTTGTTTSTSAAPGTTTTSSSGPVETKPKAQVRYAPQGGIETGFGGTARI